MDFKQAVETAFRKYVVFTGRARRSEYWWFTLFFFVAIIVASIIDAVVLGTESTSVGPIYTIVALGCFLPSLAVGVRRLHDLDKSGWWLLIGIIPIVGAIILIIWFVKQGTTGDNKFGPDPMVAIAESA
jgi:uncharacterized membrane protein YhaH (DUF805 family)